MKWLKKYKDVLFLKSLQPVYEVEAGDIFIKNDLFGADIFCIFLCVCSCGLFICLVIEKIENQILRLTER